VDWVKGEAVEVVSASLVYLDFIPVIRKSPRRWWLYFWVMRCDNRFKALWPTADSAAIFQIHAARKLSRTLHYTLESGEAKGGAASLRAA